MTRDPGLSSEESAALLGKPGGQNRSGRGKRVLMVLAGLALVLFVAVAFLPRLASPLLNGRTVVKSDRVNATIASTSLGWFGGQRVKLALTDGQSKPAGALDIAVDRGLLALLANWYDLGTITIAGDAELRDTGASGVQPPPASGRATVSVTTTRIPLPKGLRARIELNLSKLGVVDASGKSVAELREVKSLADVRIGSPLTLDFDARSGSSPISAKIRVENWTQPDGSISLDSGTLAKNSPKIDAKVKVDDLSVALVDALVATATGKERRLRSILGETVSLNAEAAGEFSGGNASLNIRSAGAQAEARLALKDGIVSLTAPATVRVASAATRALLDSYADPAKSGGFVVTESPEASLTIEELNLKLPAPALDLRGARLRAIASLSNTAGKIALGEGQPASEVSIPELRATVSSDDLAGVVRLNADAASSISSAGKIASGGKLNADLSTSGLLDANGAPIAGLPKTIDGRISLRGASTEILQPIVAGALANSGLSLDLPRDIGPTADVELVAKTEGSVIDVDLNATAQSASATGALRMTETALATREKGLTIEAANAGSIVARSLNNPSLKSARPSGRLGVTIASLNLPLEAGTRKPKLDQLAMKLAAVLTDWAFIAQVPAAEGQIAGRPVALDLRSLNADVALTPGKGGEVRIASDAGADGAPVKLGANLTLPAVFAALGGVKAAPDASLAQKLGPALALGRIELTGLPASIADALPRAGANDTGKGALVREAVGDTIGLIIESAQPGADTMQVKATVQGSHANLAVQSVFEKSGIVASASGAGTISPGLVGALIAGNAPDKPRLRAPASYTITTEPLTVPFDATGSPDIAKAGVLKARAAVSGQAVVESGTQAYGVQDFAVNASLPVSALGAGSGGAASLDASGGLLSADGTQMGALIAKAALPLGANLTLAGPADIEVRLNEVNTVGLDRALGQPLLVSGALGPSAAIAATTRITPPGGKPVGVAEALSKADLAADVTLNSQRLEIKRPLRARAEGDRITLESPEPIVWTIDPAWFDRFVLGKGQSKAQGKAETDLALAAPARAELVITRAVVARTNAERGIAGPMYPGIFALDSTARIHTLELVDSRSVRTQMNDAVLKLESASSTPGQPIAINFDLSFAKLAIVPDASKAGPGGGVVRGSIAGLATAQGVLDTANPIITASGEIRSLPSALIDAFSVKNGLPGEILGPSVNFALNAKDFSRAGGSLVVSAASTETGAVVDNGVTKQLPRAEMAIRGVSQNGVLVGPLNVVLRKVDVGLDKRLSGVLPIVADVEKRFEDRPASVASPQLAIPLDGDTAKLNGTLAIDPGDARFKTSGVFGSLLRAVKARDQGKVLQRLQPVNLTITNGVITYPRWEFPMGEFKMEIEGTVDLPKNYVDMIAWVPIGQLADDVSGVFSKIPGVGTAGNTLNQATMVPIRFSGPMGNTKTSPDVGLFGKNFIKNVNPEKVVDVLKDIFKKPK